MATATPTKPCFTCGKVTGRVKCEGCSKIFCLNDFEGQQQELTKQLEEVEVTRDLFRQSLTDKITDSRKHPLIEQIDEWENKSINKVRQTAEEIRQILIKHTAELNTKLEDRLSKLTNQLRQSREAKDFFETELNQWKEELTQMKNELIKPSSVAIRQDPTPLVTRINVKISDVTYDIQPNKKTHVTGKERCVRNPTNITRKQQPNFNGTVNQNLDQLHHVDQFNDMTAIPCEYCGKSFEWRHFEEHVHTCATQDYERRQNQSRPTDIEHNKRYVRCKYCNKDRSALTIKIHETFCTEGHYSAASSPRQ